MAARTRRTPARISPIRGCRWPPLAGAIPGLTFAMDVKSYWIRARSTPPAVVLVVSASLGAIGAFLPAAAAQQARTEAQDHIRLLELQRQAVTQLQQAAR